MLAGSGRRKGIEAVAAAAASVQIARQQATRAAGSVDLKAAFKYCSDLVRNTDHENFLWAAQLPKDLRPAVFALRAFNVETGLVAESTKEPTLAQLRLTWWRDAVSGLDRAEHNHPVLHALAALGLSPGARYHLQRIVSTRETDAAAKQAPASIAELEKYAEGTASQLLTLQCKACAADSTEADHAASHLGKAVGMVALLRGTAHHAQRRRSYLPADICAQARVSQEQVYRGESSDALCDVVFQTASVANGHLEEARRLQPKLEPRARLMMLPGVAAGLYLQALEKARFDPYSPALAGGGFSRLKYQFVLKWRMLRGTY